MERLTERSPRNNMAYLMKVKSTEQVVECQYPNTLRCITEAFERLAAYEDTGLSPDEIPHWIPVGERLPKEIEYREADARELIPLLVCVEGTEYPFRAFYDGKSWGDGWSKLDVTFWMSLPQPPKDGAK